jgi:hypothetical protein
MKPFIIIYKDNFRDAIYELPDSNADICIVKNNNLLFPGIQIYDTWISHTFDILTNIKYKKKINCGDINLPLTLSSNMIGYGNFNVCKNYINIHTIQEKNIHPGLLNLNDILSADAIFLRPKLKKILKSQEPDYSIQYMELPCIMNLLQSYSQEEIINR